MCLLCEGYNNKDVSGVVGNWICNYMPPAIGDVVLSVFFYDGRVFMFGKFFRE